VWVRCCEIARRARLAYHRVMANYGNIFDMQRRITTDPGVMVGKPCVAGTCITVETIVRRMAEGYTVEEVLADYPAHSISPPMPPLAH
jgi:uncharacterized protein (DUF433 family)